LHRIISILPKGEGFSPQACGAIGLCVRDFTLHSRYRSDTLVVGGDQGVGFEGVDYKGLPPVRWYQNRTRTYARLCTGLIKSEGATLAEIHNRPHILRLIASARCCKLALHLHNDPQEMDDARTPQQRQKLLDECAAVYCVSGYIRNRFLEGLGDKASAKVHVVYNGITVPTSVAPKEKLILYVGRMTEGKGALLLAEALTLALPRIPGWRALLIGSNRHAQAKHLTAYEDQVAGIITSLAPHAELLGFLPHEETLGFFAHAAISVIPSLWKEPFGRTALEAMAYGAALISSGRGGLQEVTQDSALTLSDLTAERLANAIVLLAQNNGERTRLAEAGRKQAQTFSIANCTRTLDDARAAILASKDRHAA